MWRTNVVLQIFHSACGCVYGDKGCHPEHPSVVILSEAKNLEQKAGTTDEVYQKSWTQEKKR